MTLKSFYFLALLLVITTAGHAQFIKSFAVKGGISIARLKTTSGNISITSDYRVGPFGAFNFRFVDNPYWGLSADLGFIRKGARGTDINTSEKITTAFDYITLSPMVHGKYVSGHWAPYVFAGPRVEYLCAVSSSNGVGISYKDPSRNKLSIGMTYGFGIEYQLNQMGIQLEAQHQPDFTKLHNSSAGYMRGNAYVINTGVRIYFGQ